MKSEEEKRIDEKLEEMRRLKDVVKNLQDDAYWKQVRINASTAAMQGILSNLFHYKEQQPYSLVTRYLSPSFVIEKAVEYADALVAELKKNEKEE